MLPMKRSYYLILTLFFLLTNGLLAQTKANLEGIEIGTMAPEIALPTIDGEIIKLSQLNDKIVLINFWASWCAPCRRKAPELIEVLNKYKDTDFEDGEKGFEIFSVSLDKNVLVWKNSIEKDGTGDFLNVGDMEGWKCPAAVTYNIRSIPSTVLLNGEGKIIAINLSPKELNKKLKRMKKNNWFWF